MNRRESELLRLGESIIKMANDVALATAGTSDAAYARQEARCNQGTITIFVTRIPEIAALMESAVAAKFQINAPVPEPEVM